MYRKHKRNRELELNGLKINIPPNGVVFNIMNNAWEERDILSRSAKPAYQYWERAQPPADYETKRKKEMLVQKTNPEYYNPELQAYRNQEWDRRLNGLWFYNNGRGTYLTGLHYFYLTHWKLDIGYPEFRITDLHFFYFLEYCVQDPNCMGMVEVTKRRAGKTMRAGAFLFELTSRSKNKNAGIQSKTYDDAKDNVFAKGIVMPFKYLPDFFIPIYDTEKGMTPKGELRFFKTNKRGANDNIFTEKVELESQITFKSSEKFAYDGTKLHRYLADEAGKCFGLGTKIRMIDGSQKNVEDILDGEIVMGDDSTGRVVFGVTSGQEEMFEIIPNKGDGFICNRSHILSLSVSDRLHFNGKKYTTGHILNISVNDYLNIKPVYHKCLALYRKGWELKESKHIIPPYLLGVWLGDGTSSATAITGVDDEIIEYLYKYAKENKLNVSKNDITYYLGSNKSYTINGTYNGKEYEFKSKKEASTHFGFSGKFESTGVYKNGDWEIAPLVKNKFRDFLIENNLINNKHIPEDFMQDSAKNRLQLLAGIIDTDGSIDSKNGYSKGFEITQKNKRLSYQIKELATSLGFYASLNPKMATMKRRDGTIYSCEVYRVYIYGDIDSIPTKIKRKQAIVSRTKNRKNPLKTGFKINSIGKGNYYGFAVDKNNLFLLGDGTVVHNTSKVNVYDRHQVVQFCLQQEETIIGKALYTTTVEEMEDGGESFKELWQASNQSKKNANGRTKSGLYHYFLPAYKTLFYDKYGIPDEDKAKEFYMGERNALMDDNRALASFIRKNPFTIEEAFFSEAESCIYDALALNRQKESITWIDKKELYLQGDFVWEKAERDTRVLFVEKANGKFKVHAKANIHDHTFYNQVEDYGSKKVPKANKKYSIAVDPFDHSITTSNERSDGAGYAYRRYDATDELSETFLVQYINRPDKAEIFYEDMIKLAHFFGCEVLSEDNKVGLIKYFEYRGYERFLTKMPNASKYGISATVKTHQQIAEETESYITDNLKKVIFTELLDDWLHFNINKTTKFDAAMAAGYTLIAASKSKFAQKAEQKVKLYDVREIFL